ncbi:phosphatidylinositol-4-phosphate 5-kinase type I, putative, partial [Ixodes scapularis]
IGHRRVDEEGQITYKKIQTSQIIGSIQLGIGYAVGSLASKPERDLLMQDFAMVESIFFPGEGSNLTPAHHYSDFKFKAYAPVAFRYFRDLFGIQPDDFLLSLCNESMRELTNPGASGSIFYLTNDDEFIIKTVQHKEAEFLQNLLPGYYMNLNQNPRTLLPKFFGLYCYQVRTLTLLACVRYSILYLGFRFLFSLKPKVTPSNSTTRLLTMVTYLALPSVTAEVLWAIFSAASNSLIRASSFEVQNSDVMAQVAVTLPVCLPEGRGKMIRFLLTTCAHSFATRAGGIPARNSKGERLLLFLGVIDILQSYRLKKKLEHTWKSMFHDGDSVSVHRPSFYAQRFQDFMAKRVFKKIP